MIKLKLLLLVFGSVLLVASLGCTPAFEAPESSNGPVKGDPGGACHSGKDMACLFYKNPVAHKAEAKPILANLNDWLAERQDYQARISNLDSSGYLQNSSVLVYSEKRPRAQAGAGGNWNYYLNADVDQKAGQIMAYYWANKFIEEMNTKYPGDFSANAKGIKIMTDAYETGWSANNNVLFLSRTSSKNSALDAGVIVHLLAEANLSYATSSAIYDLTSDTKHVDCGLSDAGLAYKKDCCVDKFGCSKAISMGQADFLTAVYFPETKGIGEFQLNMVDGASTCGVSRDLTTSMAVSADSAYAACTSKTASGYVYSMGTIYGSIWYNVYNQVKQSNPSQVDDFMKLFFRHLKDLRGDHNFTDALGIIQAIDSSQHSSSYSALFQTEFTARGL